MTEHKANALHIRLAAMSGKFADPAERYTQAGADLLVPYLMGYGLEADRMAEWNLYEPEEIKAAVDAFRAEWESCQMPHVHWRRWCSRVGYTTEEVFQGCIEGVPSFIDLMRAARAWCRILGIQPWVNYPSVKQKRAAGGLPTWTNTAACTMPVRAKTMSDIVQAIEKACGVTFDDLSSKRRHPSIVLARAIGSAAMRTLTDASYPEIARAMGLPNHSTTITAHRWFSAVWINAHRSYGPGKMVELHKVWKLTMSALDMPRDTSPKQATGRYVELKEGHELRRTA